MIRQSLAANSAHAYLGLLPPGAVQSLRRSTAGASATPAAGANTSVNLAWSAVAGAAGYWVERSVGGVIFSTLITVGPGVTSYTDSNVWGSTRWFYRVEAADGTTRYSPPAGNQTSFNATGLVPGTAHQFRITPLTSVGDGAAPSMTFSTETRMPAPANFRFTAKSSNSMTIAWDG